MPETDATSPMSEPPAVSASLWNLDGAHARVTSRGLDEVEAVFGSTLAQVGMIGYLPELRQLLDDAIAQLAAIEATQ